MSKSHVNMIVRFSNGVVAAGYAEFTWNKVNMTESLPKGTPPVSICDVEFVHSETGRGVRMLPENMISELYKEISALRARVVELTNASAKAGVTVNA
jgi:hypothetical protein